VRRVSTIVSIVVLVAQMAAAQKKTPLRTAGSQPEWIFSGTDHGLGTFWLLGQLLGSGGNTDHRSAEKPDPSEIQRRSNESMQLAAFATCRVAIKNSLNVPSGAEIDEYGFGVDSMKGHISVLHDHTFRTYHRVEAQNALGAKLRKQTTCDMSCSTEDECAVLKMVEN